MTDPLTDEESAILKTAAFGAVFLVSNVDPGLLALISESFAASAPIAGATGLVRAVLTTGALPKLPTVGPGELSESVLPALRRSVRILCDKAPDEVENYQSVVVRAIEAVAKADRTVTEPETAMLASIKDALSVSPADRPGRCPRPYAPSAGHNDGAVVRRCIGGCLLDRVECRWALVGDRRPVPPAQWIGRTYGDTSRYVHLSRQSILSGELRHSEWRLGRKTTGG